MFFRFFFEVMYGVLFSLHFFFPRRFFFEEFNEAHIVSGTVRLLLFIYFPFSIFHFFLTFFCKWLYQY